MTPPVPLLRHVLDAEIEVGTPIEVARTAAGERRIVPILGGRVRGPGLSGRVLAGANDYQIVRGPALLELQARYVVETDDGSRIYVENNGLRSGPADVMERLRRGEAVDPSQIYFRAVPRFETDAPAHAWMMQRLFVSSGLRTPDRVILAVFEVT
jgi:hypothetical protein